MSEENDMALGALLKTLSEMDIDFSTDLLRQTYEIQRRHQFDREDLRGQSMQDLQRLLDATLDGEASQ